MPDEIENFENCENFEICLEKIPILQKEKTKMNREK